MKKLILTCLESLSRAWARGPNSRKKARAFGEFLGWLWIDVLGVRRGVIAQNLEIAFPFMEAKEKQEIGRLSVRRMAGDFSEVLIIPQIHQKWVEENIVLEGEENLKAAQALGKGVYVLTLHLRSGDIAAAVLSFLGHRLHLISKKIKTRWLNDLWFHFRGGQGVKYIDAHSDKTAFEILRAIKSKEMVIFVADQFIGRPFAVETRFFNRKTGTPYGLALFYLKTRSPVVPIYSYEGSDNKLHIVIEKALDLESLVTSDQNENIRRLTQKFNDVMEQIITQHPKDWMWVHRRWKDYE